MGLLAIVASQARRVDLLPKLVRVLPGISVLLIIAGLLNLAWLPLDGNYRNTYFSENALLAHQAITFFRETEWDIVRGYKGQVREYHDLNTTELDRNTELANIFRDFGLQAHTHDWRSNTGDESGQNFYAINMAPRGPHNEAIVIAAPWIAENGVFNEGGVALLVSLARFFQRWNFWHKNLIFVISSNSEVALRQWVNAYHSTLQYTAGSIEGAVVLDYASDAEFFDHIDICFEGLNGQLPNLDLVNTAVYSVAAEFSQARTLGFDFVAGYADRLTSLARNIWQQMMAGVAPKKCGSSMFSGWRVDAVTLRAVPGNSHYDITTLGRVCESTVRSINNLLEHFHQSFFFYLLLGPSKFVSIASYLPSGMLVASSFSIMALHRIALTNKITGASFWRASGVLFVPVVLVGFILYVNRSRFAAISAFALLGLWALKQSFSLRLTEKRLVSALSLALVGLQLTTLSMVNFSLALGLGIACAPLAWVDPGNNVTINILLVTLASPLSILSSVAYAMHMPLSGLLAQLVRSMDELSVWTWPLILAVWLPLWAASIMAVSMGER